MFYVHENNINLLRFLFNIYLFHKCSDKKSICYERKWLAYPFFLDSCLQVHLHRNIYFWITYKNYCKRLLFGRFYFPSGPMELAWLHCHYICVSVFFGSFKREYSLTSMSLFKKKKLALTVEYFSVIYTIKLWILTSCNRGQCGISLWHKAFTVIKIIVFTCNKHLSANFIHAAFSPHTHIHTTT